MTHRGPDDAGCWRREPGGNVALGLRRLAIVDTSELGRQPMANEDGTVQAVFNGEIYNHAELRADLQRRGHRFRSRCDTEVLVHLYEERGPAMVDHLVGMFAFAIWDEGKESLFMARDRLGIKPLYWLDDGRRFAFASEIRALVPLLQTREVDPTSLFQYLTFVAVPAPRTMFAGIAKLGPAEAMMVGPKGPQRPWRYWDPIANRARFDGEAPEWESAVRARLERSIELQLMSDVPLGAFLSGGVDSSSNVALMSGLVRAPINTFTVGYHGIDAYNEFGWASQIADRFGCTHHELRVDANQFWQGISAVVRHLDEPVGHTVSVPIYLISRLAKESGVTVALFGEGSDEIFAGYPAYEQFESAANRAWHRFRRLPPLLRTPLGTAAGALMRLDPNLEFRREVLLRAMQRKGRLWWGQGIGFYDNALRRITTRRLQAAVAEQPADVILATAAEADRAGARDELDRIIYQDLRLRLPEQLLIRADKLTMANSLEGRFPFLDHKLVELAMALPFDEKIRDGVGKHALKRAMGDLLPAELLWRPKQAFSSPFGEWLRDGFGDRVERQLRRSAIGELGYLNMPAVQQLLDLHRSGRAERSNQIWPLFSLSAWFDYWVAGREPALA